MMVSQKRIIRYVVSAAVIFTVFHVFYSSGSFINPPSKSYTIYHQDEVNKLIVLQVDTISKTDGYNHISSKPRVNPKDFSDYSIQYIDGYDYTNLTNSHISQLIKDSKFDNMVKIDYENRFINLFVKFFDDLFQIIEDAKPSVDSINNNEHYKASEDENKYVHNKGRLPLYGGHLRENYLDEVIRTKEFLSSFLRLSDEETESLSNSHKHFLTKMPRSLPKDILKYSKFNDYMKGDGIVYLGGDDYNQLALTSIKMLRSSGSKLPIELIVPREKDYDIDLCNNILPSLDGKCKVMAHYLPKEIMDKIGGYQLKNVALMISSFKRVLYLDADNIPVSNPDMFFNNEPLKSHDLVLWPDLWRRSTSPKFYDIAGIKVDDNIRVRNSYFNGDKRGESNEINYHDSFGSIPEASSETGQLLINKEVHFTTLILSMYYNYYGPEYYYALLSQGAAGEGDKETFIAAAHKLNLPYYQVQEFNREFGPPRPGNKHEFFGMGQYNPIIDYIQHTNRDQCLTTEFVPDYGVNSNDKEHSNYDYHYFKSSSLMFLHANWPKLKLSDLFIHNGHGRGPKVKNSDERRRLYDKNIIDETGGFDFELSIFQTLQWLYCDLNIELKRVPSIGSGDRDKICSEINSQLIFLVS